MYRPRSTSIAVFAPALLMLAVVAGGCSSAPEEPLLRQYFRASQLRDNGTLSNFSAVTFDPRTDGIVTSFTITNVSEERRQPLQLKDLAKAQEAARTADEEFSKRMKAYQDAHFDAIERVLKAEGANGRVGGNDAAVQAEWRKWREEAATSAKAVSEARSKVNSDRPIVELSVERIGDPVDVTTVDGEMITKDVTIDAQVRMPSGETVPKQLVITLEQAQLKIPSKPAPLVGRWVITAIKGA
jgi:hypothetical protein